MSSEVTQDIEPGVYFDMPDPDYFALPYASKSGLWRVHLMPDTIQTIEQARAWLEFPKTTYAMRLGRAFDDAMSFGDSWRDRWTPGPVNEKTGKGYGGDTQKFAAAVDEHGENVIVPEDMDEVDSWRDAVLSHPDARELIQHPKAKHQAVVVWDDERTGQRCKGKIDLLTARGNVTCHADYKTWTKKRRHVPSEIAFAWECEDRGYAVQAAHYLDGCEAIDKLRGRAPRRRDFTIIAVNKTPDVIESTGEMLYEVDVLDFALHDLEGALRVRDTLLETWISIQDGTWQPTRRGTRTLRLSQHTENDYAERPL